MYFAYFLVLTDKKYVIKYEKEVDKMDKQKAKVNGRIRYDNAFKQGAIQMITEQHIPIRRLIEEFLSIWIISKSY